MDIGGMRKSRSRNLRLNPSCSLKESSSESKPIWTSLWRKIVKQYDVKKKKKMTCYDCSYDWEGYMQNFDQGSEKGNVDFLCRSFSARFANPSSKNLMV
ncbi:hypothetical protein Ccrd_008043 [Cynara cardunculus var. scolymus]|uniref:Uncharacterized protein n=1 Tax=Cynara cardunculus var. scolymus TaxID=59895 RepID=A0A118JTJ0_CYNCS|nr:hypothetical protein Ccrd_008043 [Cynara cardunculus var. scolymus]